MRAPGSPQRVLVRSRWPPKGSIVGVARMRVALVVASVLVAGCFSHEVMLLDRETPLGDQWLHLEAPEPLKPKRTSQEVLLLFREGLATYQFGALGAGGEPIVPEVELRDRQGNWVRLTGLGRQFRGGKEYLFFQATGLARDPYTAVRIRAPRPLTLRVVLWQSIWRW